MKVRGLFMLAMFGTVQRLLPQGAASILSCDEREDKEYLLGDVIRATLVRMTEFSPLGYVASLLILALVVSYAVLLQTSTVVREQSRLLFMVPFALLLWITGKLLGLGAWMGKCIAWLLYSLTELWGPRPVAGFLKGIVDSMDLYRRRQLVPARHAA